MKDSNASAERAPKRVKTEKLEEKEESKFLPTTSQPLAAPLASESSVSLSELPSATDLAPSSTTNLAQDICYIAFI